MIPAAPTRMVLVRPATADDSKLDQLADRATWTLLALACVAGGGYALMLGRRRLS